MVSRARFLIGIGLPWLAASGFAQTPLSPPATAVQRAAPGQGCAAGQAATRRGRLRPPRAAMTAQPQLTATQPGVPHTLAEALAATYSNQPALAGRAGEAAGDR